MRELARYCWLITLLCITHFSFANTLYIDNVQSQYKVNGYLEIIHDADENITFQNLESQLNNFKPLQEWKKDLLPNTTYWGKLEISNRLVNQSDLSEWVMHFSLIFTDMDIYVVDEKGGVKKYRTGYFIHPAERSFVPVVKANVVKFNMPVGESVTIYFKGKNERRLLGTEFEMLLQDSSSFFLDLKKEKQWNAMFIGFVLMMFVYNLFLYFYSSDRAYLYYSIYILSITLFTAYNSGDLADWLNRFSLPKPPILIHYSKVFIYLIMISYTLFVRYFLNLEKLLPQWDTIFKWLGIVSIIAMFLDFFLLWNTNYSYNIVDVATFGWTFVFLFVGYRFLIPLYKSKDPKGIFIIAGFVFMGIGVLLTAWERMQSVDFSVIYFRIGIILEIISFSLGLAYRQKEVEEEKRQADFELERTKMLQDIEHKEAERLKELNNLKSRLYANITHEFRTPLTVIMGMAENIKEDGDTKELIQRNSQNLLQLINQLLDLSKAESGKLEIKMIQGDIINFLRYLTESFHSMASGKNIQLTFYSEEKELVMDFDEQKIQYIVYNLLSNAIKYTPEKGKVIFHVKKHNNNICLKVKDTGVGISTEDQPYVFDRFYKVDNTSTRKVDGVGIGLALTKELIEILSGEITLQSELGEGSEFIVELPITNTAKFKTIENKKTNGQVTAINSEREFPIKDPIFVIEKSKGDTPILLVVEDNEDVAKYIQNCVKDDYNVVLAQDGEEGIQKALEIIPDIIISDLMMPLKDGFEVCSTLKNDERTSHIPIILLTAKATQEDKIEGLETGADAYMMKPFHKKELIIRLKKLIESRAILQTKYGNGKLPLATKTPQNIEDEFLHKVVKVMEGELENPKLSVSDLSQKMHLSPTQLYRKVKAVTGLPPTKYIRKFRLQKGLELVQKTPKTIAEIAYDVGFNDPNYFSRAFSEEFGKTPSEFRK